MSTKLIPDPGSLRHKEICGNMNIRTWMVLEDPLAKEGLCAHFKQADFYLHFGHIYLQVPCPGFV